LTPGKNPFAVKINNNNNYYENMIARRREYSGMRERKYQEIG
jgi:hypothetical protein